MARITIRSTFNLVLISVLVTTLVLIGKLARLEDMSRVTILNKLERTLDKATDKDQLNANVHNATNRYQCEMVKPKLSSTPLPITGLVSYPGAGNTWTRHLIQQATGLATGSEFCDTSILYRGFPLECHKNYSQVVAVKSHWAPLDVYSRVILILRNPVSTILAFFNYSYAGHTGIPPATTYAKKWPTFFSNTFRGWTAFYQKWLCNYTGPMHTVLYENLQTDPFTELKSLFDFLNIKVFELSLVCAIQNQEGNLHRKNASQTRRPKILISEAMMAKITAAADRVAKCFHSRYGVKWDLFPKTIRESIHYENTPI